MSNPPNQIGRFNRNVPNIASEYQRLAQEDEEVGLLLVKSQKYRHAIYFFIQSMEKYIRYRIFLLVNAENNYFREKTRTHNVDELLDFLVEITSSDPVIRDQIKKQLDDYVLGGVRFGDLHNNLRYPFFSNHHQAYSMLGVGQADASLVHDKLQKLKLFLRDIDKLNHAH